MYPMTLFKGGDSRECKSSAEEAMYRSQGFAEPYKFQEYPKHLYLNGERTAADRVVKTKDEEDAARAEGFRMISDPAPEAKKESEKKAEPEKKAKGA